MRCKNHTPIANYLLVLTVFILFNCSSIQNVFGPHISVLSQNFECDTTGLRVYTVTETMNQTQYDSLKSVLESFIATQNGETWLVQYTKKDWESISSSIQIKFENDGSDTAFNISFKLKIVSTNGSTTITTNGGALAPGKKKTITETIKENVLSVKIDEILY